MKVEFGDVEQFVTELRRIGDATAAPTPSGALMDVLEGGRVPRASAVAPQRRRWLRPVVMPATVATVLFGGLAAAGALPAPVQHATASFAAHLGVTIPGHHETTPSSPAPAASVHAGGEASTPSRHTTVATHSSSTANPTPTHVASPPSTAAVNGSGHVSSGPLPVTPPKLVPPTIPNVTVPTLPQPTVPTVPPVTVPGMLP